MIVLFQSSTRKTVGRLPPDSARAFCAAQPVTNHATKPATPQKLQWEHEQTCTARWRTGQPKACSDLAEALRRTVKVVRNSKHAILVHTGRTSDQGAQVQEYGRSCLGFYALNNSIAVPLSSAYPGAGVVARDLADKSTLQVYWMHLPIQHIFLTSGSACSC